MPRPKVEVTATATDLGSWIGVTRQRVEQLAEEGVLRRAADGRYALKENNLAYIAWLKDDQRRNNRSAADGRLKDERARREAMKTAREERELIPYAEAQSALDEIVGLVASEVRALPARMSRDKVERVRIEKEVDGILTRVADRLSEQGTALRTGSEPSEADAEDDAGEVGEE